MTVETCQKCPAAAIPWMFLTLAYSAESLSAAESAFIPVCSFVHIQRLSAVNKKANFV